MKFLWDERLKRYRDATTGRLVKAEMVRAEEAKSSKLREGRPAGVETFKAEVEAKGFIWDEKLKRFREGKTGRMVKKEAVKKAVAEPKPFKGRWNPFEHKEGELLKAVCERCGKNFQVFYDWRWDAPPKHFYCSAECFFSSGGG